MADQENHNKTLSDYKDDYYYYTGQASKINRSLALGGIAVIWIFKITEAGNTTIPNQLLFPLFLLILSLGLDLLQYIIAGLIWFVFFLIKERQVNKGELTKEDNIDAHIILPLIIHLFYWSKIVAMFIAYYYLSSFVYLKFINPTI